MGVSGALQLKASRVCQQPLRVVAIRCGLGDGRSKAAIAGTNLAEFSKSVSGAGTLRLSFSDSDSDSDSVSASDADSEALGPWVLSISFSMHFPKLVPRTCLWLFLRIS